MAVSETANGNGSEGSVRFSVRELFADIKKEITDLRGDIANRDRATTERVEKLEHDFAGYVGRFTLHEALPGHVDGIKRVAVLEATVATLSAQAEVRSALETYIEKAGQRSAETHRWLIGLTMSQLVAIGIVVWRVLETGHP